MYKLYSSLRILFVVKTKLIASNINIQIFEDESWGTFTLVARELQIETIVCYSV